MMLSNMSDITSVLGPGLSEERKGTCHAGRHERGADDEIRCTATSRRVPLSPRRRSVGVVGRRRSDARLRTRHHRPDGIASLPQTSRRPTSCRPNIGGDPHLRGLVQQPAPHRRHERKDTLGGRGRRPAPRRVRRDHGQLRPQAKGIPTLVYAIPADRVFDVLTWHSQETNVKVLDIAEKLPA